MGLSFCKVSPEYSMVKGAYEKQFSVESDVCVFDDQEQYFLR